MTVKFIILSKPWTRESPESPKFRIVLLLWIKPSKSEFTTHIQRSDNTGIEQFYHGRYFQYTVEGLKQAIYDYETREA